MKTKDNGNVIYSLPGLPKKKLQDLCKKHGLSPYKTKPNLVSSLVPYIKVNVVNNLIFVVNKSEYFGEIKYLINENEFIRKVYS